MKKLFFVIFAFNFLMTSSQNISIDDFENQATISEVSAFTNQTIDYDKTVHTEKISGDEPFTSMVLKERLAILDANTPFDVPYNATVERFIRLYLKNKKEAISKLMDRAEYYFPMFEEQLDRYDIPLEIKYLAVVESALLPTATSHAGAKGIWQFMYHTGKEYGLDITSYIDERNDPFKATEAACKFLKHLYDRFGDWDLALAAYNSGAGNVNKAIRRSGGKRNYWNIRQHLPKETSSYVPAFYAMFYLFEYGNIHQIYPNTIEIDYFDTDTLHVYQQLSFSQIERKTGISNEFLTSLNPQYKLGVIPFHKEKTHVLTLPKNSIDKFLSSDFTTNNDIKNIENVAHITPNEHNSYVVKELDNLSKIAKKNGITLYKLKTWNGLQTNFLIEGQRLVITDKKSETALQVPIKKIHIQDLKTKTQTYKTYRVKNGDSLFIISKKFTDVSINQLRNWNNIWGVSYVEPGTELKILTNTE